MCVYNSKLFSFFFSFSLLYSDEDQIITMGGKSTTTTIKNRNNNNNVFAKITTISKSISSPYATLPRKFNQQLSSSSSMMTTTATITAASALATSPFIELPNPLVAIEYKKGYIRRKCCYDSNGHKSKCFYFLFHNP